LGFVVLIIIGGAVTFLLLRKKPVKNPVDNPPA